MSTAEGWECPACGQPYGGPDGSGMVRCPNGHRAYAGYVAESAYLRRRLAWLGDRISGGEAAPDPETSRAYGVWPATAPTPSSPPGGGPAVTGAPATGFGAGRQQPAEPGAGVQTLLLVVGAGLLVVAGIVFAAVVWDRLGALGQVVVMAALTLGCAALAVRLRDRLPGTGEALAVVAFGLAAIDVVAAPSLGLVPESWLGPDHAYLSLAIGALAVAGVLLGRRLGLAAWSWLGWSAVALATGFVSWWLALAPLDGVSWNPVAVGVVSVSAVVLAAAPYLWSWVVPDRGPLVVAGSFAAVLAALTFLVGVASLDRGAFLGSALAVLLTSLVSWYVWRRTAVTLAGALAVALVGVTGGLLLLLLPATEAPWPGLVAGIAGLALLLAFAARGRQAAGLLASATLWGTWGLGWSAVAAADSSGDAYLVQLASLLAVVSAVWFIVALTAPEPDLVWFAALTGWLAWLAVLARWDGRPHLPEMVWLPLAALLLLAGWIWRRRRPTAQSIAWLGPAVTGALVPSALACWGASWVSAYSDQSDTEAVVRLLAVLAAGVLLVAAGVRLRLAGLVVPAVAALALVGAAQVWSGVLAVPRWISIGVAGALLLALGARVEWLRRESRRLRTYLDRLD